MDWSKRLQTPEFWLLAAVAAIAALHLALLNRADQSELFATSLLFWLAAGSLIWERRHTLDFESGIFPSLLGLALLAFVLVRTAPLPTSPNLLRVLPLIGVVGIGLLASGFRGLRQYWRELLIFGVLAIQPIVELLLKLLNLPQLTAKAGTFILWYSGIQVQRQDLFLVMPTGRVEVYEACSGISSVLLMLSIAVLFLVMFPPRATSRIGQVGQIALCVIVAVLLGFVVNAFRVALMALLVAFSHKDAFEYWHTGDGSLIFSVISVLLFGGFCWLTFLRQSQDTADTGVQTNE